MPRGLAACAALFAAIATDARAEAPRLRLALEAGTELDSNVHRVALQEGTADASVAAAGGRVAARATLGWRPRAGHALRLHVIGAAKGFAFGEDASSADVGVVTGDARWDARLGERPVVATVRASYYDAIERDLGPNRDFRTGDAAVALTLLGEDEHRLTATLGYRLFHYKPNDAFDFGGEILGLAWRRTADVGDGPTLDVMLGYLVQRRRYDSDVIPDDCPVATPLCRAPIDRVDLYHTASAEVTYTSERLLTARYDLQVNDSNSDGHSLLRHRVEVGLTTETWLDVFLTAKVLIQINDALDDVLLSTLPSEFTIEDESRNALILHLTRELSPAWSVEARGSFYTNAFADSSLDYRRATLYLGAVWALPDRP